MLVFNIGKTSDEREEIDMKKKIVWQGIGALIVVFTFVFLSAFNQSTSAQENETDKVYKIAMGQNYMPFNFQGDDGELTGIDIEILKAIAEEQGFEYELQSYQLSGLLQALESEQADVGLAALTITDERKNTMDFSDPYYESGSSFAVPVDSDIQSLEDFKGITVATKIGSTGLEVAESLQEEYGFEIQRFEDSSNMYEDVSAGNSQVLIEDDAVISYAISSGVHDLRLVGEEQAISSLALAVKKDQNQEFLKLFNTGLANIRANGTYDDIIASFFGEEVMDNVAVEGGLFTQIRNYGSELLSGMWNTIWISLLSIGIAFIFGILLGFLRVIPYKPANMLSQLYVDMMRGIPLMVLAFFIYFAIPQMTGIQLSSKFAGILTLSLNATAYIGEIIRGGFQAVDTGQIEAGRSLGLPYSHTMRYIIFPQAMKITVPSLINQFVITLKDSSILSVIGLIELTQTGRIIIARTYQSDNIWIIIALMYILIITSLTRFSHYIERRMHDDKNSDQKFTKGVRLPRSLEIN